MPAQVEKLLFLPFFFNDPATTEIYTLSLHDALPICSPTPAPRTTSSPSCAVPPTRAWQSWPRRRSDRKSTRLNSSHSQISYAVFCLKKKNTFITPYPDSCNRRRVVCRWRRLYACFFV